MRYIANSEGYIEEISFDANITCDGVPCIEYSGSVPEGYVSLEDWANNACINAYKIDGGGLVYDSSKEVELHLKWATEAEANATATKLFVNIRAAEVDFKANTIIAAMKYKLTDFYVDYLKDSSGIDQTLDDAAVIIANYLDTDLHVINKTSTDTLTFESITTAVEDLPLYAWVNLDYDGNGTVTAYMSRDNGSHWVQVNNQTLESFPAYTGKNVKMKLVLNGIVRLKNYAWGVK